MIEIIGLVLLTFNLILFPLLVMGIYRINSGVEKTASELEEIRRIINNK